MTESEKHQKVMNIIWSCETPSQLKTCFVFVDWFDFLGYKQMIIASIKLIALGMLVNINVNIRTIIN